MHTCKHTYNVILITRVNLDVFHCMLYACMSSLIGIRKYIVGLVIKLSSDPQTMQVHVYMYECYCTLFSHVWVSMWGYLTLSSVGLGIPWEYTKCFFVGSNCIQWKPQALHVHVCACCTYVVPCWYNTWKSFVLWVHSLDGHLYFLIQQQKVYVYKLNIILVQVRCIFHLCYIAYTDSRMFMY